MARTIGDWVAAWRQTRGLTQAQLAERLGVRQSTVGNWEAGRNDLARETLSVLADVLDVPPDEVADAVRLPLRAEAA